MSSSTAACTRTSGQPSSVAISSIVTGRLITRTGRYRIFPLAGSVVATFAFFLYTTLGADSSRFTASAFMIVLGAGLGMWMQTLITIAQNAVDYRDLGIATATINFFRSLGGSIGATLAAGAVTSPARSSSRVPLEP